MKFREVKQSSLIHNIVGTPSPFCRGGGRGWDSNQVFKKGGLTGPQLLEGVAGKEGGDFFQGGCNFHIKNKLKSEIFNDKKSL